jgi:hypothetical protein
LPPSAFGSVVFAIGAWIYMYVMGNGGWRGGNDHRLCGSGRATVRGRLAAQRWQAVAMCAHLDGQVRAKDYAERLGVREVDVAIERGLEIAVADPGRKGVRLPPAN